MSDASRRAMRVMSDKPEEAAALMEVYVAANPRNADGQFTLAMAYEGIAFNIKLTGDPASPARIAQLEKAADRYRSYLALVRDVADGSYRAAGLKSLARIYGRDALNRLADAERAARQLVDEAGASRAIRRLTPTVVKCSLHCKEHCRILGVAHDCA